MTARILGEMSGTLLAMFWTWRNLNEFSTMTVKEVAKVLTQGIGIAIVASIVLTILFNIFSALLSGNHNEGIEDERVRLYELYSDQLSSGLFGIAFIATLVSLGWFNLPINTGLIALYYSMSTAFIASGILKVFLHRKY
jgi:glycerol uptake facilitator-like aquaporin